MRANETENKVTFYAVLFLMLVSLTYLFSSDLGLTEALDKVPGVTFKAVKTPGEGIPHLDAINQLERTQPPSPRRNPFEFGST